MQNTLWSIRLKSFGYSAGTIILAGILTTLVSPDFLNLIVQNFGGTIWSTLAILIIPEIVKGIRNQVVVGRAEMVVGSTGDEPEIELI